MQQLGNHSHCATAKRGERGKKKKKKKKVRSTQVQVCGGMVARAIDSSSKEKGNEMEKKQQRGHFFSSVQHQQKREQKV
jgi:hypothetical protein